MKIRKWKLALLIFTGSILLTAGAGYLILVYKFKEVLKAVVKKESHGKYAFDASRVRLSLWTAKITLHDASVTAIDTSNVSAHYFLSAKRVYLSVHSLKELLFDDRLSVNDIIINEPVFDAHIHSEKPSSGEGFHGSEVTDLMSRLAQCLQVRSFEITNASFKYSSFKHPEPFIADHINLKISNFRQKDSVTNDLLYTDDIDLSITNQSWTFPGAKQDLKFARLHYSARSQFIQLDTCTITVKEKAGTGTISLYADQFRFTQKKLQEHLSKDELVIDSLICLSPMLVLHKGEQHKKASTGSISAAFNHMFKKVNLRYIDIRKGSFAIYESNRSSSSYATERADVQVFNLQALDSEANGLSVDSIKFKLNNLSFLTRDSLYQLTVGEFRLRNNDLTFLNASFGNAPANPRPSHMTFTTPELRFRNIDLEELMKKKLKAPAITIYQPNISLFAVEKNHIAIDSAEKFSTEDFYKVLHGVDELINVDSFRIIDGNMQFRSSKNNLRADLGSISGVVLINKFLKSDSLKDIKRALPEMNIHAISLTTPALDLKADKFHFNGTSRLTNIDAFRVLLNNGTTISGKKLKLEFLDWDFFQQSRVIRIDKLALAELTTTIESAAGKPGKAGNKLPELKIDTLQIARMNTQISKPAGSLTFGADYLSMTQVKSQGANIKWLNLSTNVNGFRYKTTGTELSFNSMELTEKGITQLHDLSVLLDNPSNKISVSVPLVNLKADFKSTDFSNLSIHDLQSDTADITVVARDKAVVTRNKAGSKAGTSSGPDATNAKLRNALLNGISARRIVLNKNAVSYFNERDSLTAKAFFNLHGDELAYAPNDMKRVSYEAMSLDIREINLEHKSLSASIPVLNLKLNNGNLVEGVDKRNQMNTAIRLDWKLLNVLMHMKDSTRLEANNVSGYFSAKDFEFTQGQKLSWLQHLKFAMISDGNIKYDSRQVTAALNNLNWNGPAASLATGSFYFKPNPLNPVESAWQKDEISLNGESIGMHGIRYDPASGDSTLDINMIELAGVDFVTTRDKRMPFRHGIQKLMPTRLIGSVRFPMAIDSILIKDGNILVREISEKTKKMGVIPLEQVSATITNIRNRSEGNDLLEISATAVLLDNRIDNLKYQEAYNDSMSSFSMKFNASPMRLTTFTKATQPLANVGVMNGRSDTLYAYWVGNKYAAVGRMNFYYKGLKVALLNPDDPDKKLLKQRLLNFLANTILRNTNNKEGIVFYQRDLEKFVFNYWVKTTFSGLMTSVGVKRNRKHFNQYNKVKEKYYLPSIPLKVLPVSSAPKSITLSNPVF